jgi:hypothetical protein
MLNIKADFEFEAGANNTCMPRGDRKQLNCLPTGRGIAQQNNKGKGAQEPWYRDAELRTPLSKSVVKW